MKLNSQQHTMLIQMSAAILTIIKRHYPKVNFFENVKCPVGADTAKIIRKGASRSAVSITLIPRFEQIGGREGAKPTYHIEFDVKPKYHDAKKDIFDYCKTNSMITCINGKVIRTIN